MLSVEEASVGTEDGVSGETVSDVTEDSNDEVSFSKGREESEEVVDLSLHPTDKLNKAIIKIVDKIRFILTPFIFEQYFLETVHHYTTHLLKNKGKLQKCICNIN